MTARIVVIHPDKGLIGKGPPIVENKVNHIATSSPPIYPLKHLSAFAQIFLNFQDTGLKSTARGSSASLNKGLAGHRPLILGNEAKYIGEFSLLALLLGNVFAFA